MLVLFQASLLSCSKKSEPSKGVAFEWGEWSPEAVDEALAQGRPVFVEFYADWCATCMVNQKRCFEDEEVLKLLQSRKVVSLKADFTNRYDEIKKALKEINRSDVPTYVLYLPGKEASVIRLDFIDPKYFIELVEQELKEASL